MGAGGQRQNFGHLTAVIAYIAAVQGDADRCHESVASIQRDCPAPADLWSPGLLGVLDLGLDRDEAAFDRLKVITPLPAYRGGTRRGDGVSADRRLGDRPRQGLVVAALAITTTIGYGVLY